MGSTADVIRADDCGRREAITFEHMTDDMRTARNIGWPANEWTGLDRTGRPLTITWVAGRRSRRLIYAYEMSL